MTDTDITDAQVEAVARAYCKRMGLDPDEKVNPYDVGGRALWEHYSDDAREAIAMHLAVKEVLE